MTRHRAMLQTHPKNEFYPACLEYAVRALFSRAKVAQGNTSLNSRLLVEILSGKSSPDNQVDGRTASR